jgi:hydroxymethylpyrimidine kinase/phosphomethylpyrimidine kinase
LISILTVAGSDSGGGAGIQQDLKVFTVLGAYGCSVVTALTAQNTTGVHGVEPVPPEFVARQLYVVLHDIHPTAIKTGMLVDASTVDAVAAGLEGYSGESLVVVDPVMEAKGGWPLLERRALDGLKNRLFPLANAITPNIPEAELLLGRPIGGLEDMRGASVDLLQLLSKRSGPKAVVLKGGHLDGEESVDVVACGDQLLEFSGARIPRGHTHGTGCVFSSALAVFLAEGFQVGDAVRKAKDFVACAIKGAVAVGRGIVPANPFSVIENDISRFTVVEALEEAWKRLSTFASRPLVPEVQSNLGYALPWASSVKEVAAFPGRLVALNDRVARVGCPAFGASSHVARIILTAMAYNRRYRAAMNIRHDQDYLARAEENGYLVAGFSRADEPDEVRLREGSTLVWGVRRIIERLGRIPDVIHDAGAVGKEPMIRVLGPDPVDVVEKALRIAGIAGVAS